MLPGSVASGEQESSSDLPSVKPGPRAAGGEDRFVLGCQGATLWESARAGSSL